MERYFLEPYRFVPPFRSTFWCRLGRKLVERQLKRRFGVVRWHFPDVDLLRQSLNQQAGVLLAANHCRWADPMLMGALSGQARHYFYYVASYHLFRQNKFMGWVMNRLGGYSIWREGADRESLKATASILAEADRPVVLFPEGTWFRQNDRVGVLQDGLSLITRQAARQSTRPIVVHPVAIKYWYLEDPTPEILKRLSKLERRIGWSPQGDLPILPRIEKLGGGLLTLKEIEYLGHPQPGDLDARIARLTGSQVDRLEKLHLGKLFDGWLLERVRRLRQHLTRQLHDKSQDESASYGIKKDLHDLLYCENLNAHSLEYLRSDPSLERLAETIQRIEETVTDEVEVPLAPMGATARVGPAMDVRSFAAGDRKEGDPMVRHLRTTLQGMLDTILSQGPPPEWNCPPRQPPHTPVLTTTPPLHEGLADVSPFHSAKAQ